MAALQGTGFDEGSIKLLNPSKIFYSGQNISGNLEFNLQQQLSVASINMEYHGDAFVEWEEEETYEGHEEYLNFTQSLLGGRVLQPGKHVVPFQHQLPPNAPSSFEGSKGKVVYWLDAYILLDSNRRTEKIEETFEVVAPVDLNQSDEAKQPIDMEFEEFIGCGCFSSSKPVRVKIELPVSGYCPGQAVPVAVHADNDSLYEIKNIVFQIVKKERYRSNRPVSEYCTPKEVIATIKKGAILIKSQRDFTCDLMVPKMIAPNLENCGIIDVGYFFNVIIKMTGCNDDLEDEVEIAIGLIPLQQLGEYTHPMKDKLPDIPMNNAPRTNNVPYPVQNTGYSYPQNTPYPSYPHNNSYPLENKEGILMAPLHNQIDFQYPGQNAPNYPIAPTAPPPS